MEIRWNCSLDWRITRTPGVSKDTECLTPAANPDPSLGTLTTRVEYQTLGLTRCSPIGLLGLDTLDFIDI